MMHPAAGDLALYSGGDLGWLERLRVRRHLGRCPACRVEVERFRSASASLRRQAEELPEGLNWDRLAAEMTANIHLGLEAGECVTGARREPARMTWRAAAVVASLAGVFAAAWWLNPAARPTPSLQAPRVEIRSTAAGLELNENGSAMVLLHTRGSQTVRPIIVSAPGTLRARYVDPDTGQITINHVYAE